MAKKVRLQLDDLTVKSFVTSLGVDEKEKIKGGDSTCATCHTDCYPCSIGIPTEGDPWDCTDPKGCIDTEHNC